MSKQLTKEIADNRRTTAVYVREAANNLTLAVTMLETCSGWVEERSISNIELAMKNLELCKRRLQRGIEARRNPLAFHPTKSETK